ncbi:hypothetical protein KSP40_PGU007239 [Platanthera guangdongensis]|uniref:Uncharacterized protein n=1 Tax=Platanthera guangdongensis TaxID=2320717 RepID=A0ABR2MXP5_9ASPA
MLVITVELVALDLPFVKPGVVVIILIAVILAFKREVGLKMIYWLCMLFPCATGDQIVNILDEEAAQQKQSQATTINNPTVQLLNLKVISTQPAAGEAISITTDGKDHQALQVS